MRALYYLIVFPLSRLPLAVLYAFAPFMRWLIRDLISYRKKVVAKNINLSFPHYSESEKQLLIRKFYYYLVDMFIESVRNIGIPKKHLLRRINVTNPEVMNELFDKNKSVILAGAHMANFEFLILAQDLLFKHKAIGVGMPLTNKFWNKKLNARRSRFGMHVINSLNLKEEFNKFKSDCTATLVLMDQSPGSSINAYWMQFMNQDTPVLFGSEKLAHQFDYAVVYISLRKVKRGFYQVELSLITDEPRNLKYGEITTKLTRKIESEIELNPEQWLWSHNRWKKNKPNNYAEIRKEQEVKYTKWLNSL
jgi:Kdo2-lipid IVA lauroyltransferase/acyltransferase